MVIYSYSCRRAVIETHLSFADEEMLEQNTHNHVAAFNNMVELKIKTLFSATETHRVNILVTKGDTMC